MLLKPRFRLVVLFALVFRYPVAWQDPRVYRTVPAGADRARQGSRIGHSRQVQAQIRGAMLFGVMFGSSGTDTKCDGFPRGGQAQIRSAVLFGAVFIESEEKVDG